MYVSVMTRSVTSPHLVRGLYYLVGHAILHTKTRYLFSYCSCCLWRQNLFYVLKFFFWPFSSAFLIGNNLSSAAWGSCKENNINEVNNITMYQQNTFFYMYKKKTKQIKTCEHYYNIWKNLCWVTTNICYY